MYTEYQGDAPKFYYHDEPLPLECGSQIESLRIAYHTYGELSPERDNVIWVCHALTANSDVADWWPQTVVEGGLLDPTKYFIVCANKLGSCYGSSSSLDYAPDYMSFPMITVRDMVHAHMILADALGLSRIKVLIGGSTGGAQAMEWAIMDPLRIENLVSAAVLPKCTPWVTATNEAQRMALFTDKTLTGSDPRGGGEGLAAARAISMLIFRNSYTFNSTQRDDDPKITGYRAASYQRYQGEKLRKRFDARCYLRLIDALDSHDVGRGRAGVEAALGMIRARTMLMGVDSDIMFPADEIAGYTRYINDGVYREIESPYGHDGFLIETSKLTRIIKGYFDL